MRILVLHGPLDHPETNGRLEAAARQLGVDLAISRADDEDALAAAIAAHGEPVRVPVVEVLQSQHAVALRSMVEMLRHPEA